MNVLDAVKFARAYLHGTNKYRYTNGLEDYRLHKQLQYLLCHGVDRIQSQFGEVTQREVVMLVESWVMAQGTSPGSHRPLQAASGIDQDNS